MREAGKRWLISRMKTAGSRKRYISNGRYATTRHAKTRLAPDEMPAHESIKTTRKFYNGKINYGLVVRFLRGRVGEDWDAVYAELINRIPTRLLDYREMVFWFVADKVELIDGQVWNKKSQQFLWQGEIFGPLHHTELKAALEFMEFYVHPDTNVLVRIEQKSFKRAYRSS